MSSISRFVEKSRTEMKARPILPFGAPLKLGAVGVVKEDQFSPRGSVASILHGRVGEVSTGTRTNWQVTSGADVTVKFLAKGSESGLFPQAPKGSARVEIGFGSSESFFCSVGDLRVSTMTDPADLLKKMVAAYQRGTWRKDYVLVYEIIVPGRELVLISRASNSSFLLSAKASVKVPQGSADVAGKFNLSMQNKDAIKLDSGSQPLFFNAYRIEEDWLTGRPKVVVAHYRKPEHPDGFDQV